MFFAFFVIITHSFPITGTQQNFEPLVNITNGQLSFSFLGLKGFFVISGFLIYKSFERSRNIYDFIFKRILRIFPALILMSLFIVFFIGLIVTDNSFREYLGNSSVYYYFIQSITLINFGLIKCLPGIFKNNYLGCELNGSLWTISYEFLFYLLFLFLFSIKKNKLILKLGFLFSFLLFYYFKLFYIDKYFVYDIYIPGTTIGLKAINDFGLYFLVGSIFSLFKIDEFIQNKELKVLFISFLIIIISLIFNVFSYISYIIYPIFILSIGLMNYQIFPYYKKIGDISYGIYLWAFPIQQVLEQYFHLLPVFNIFYTTIFVIPIAYVSWIFVEKPVLSLKLKLN